MHIIKKAASKNILIPAVQFYRLSTHLDNHTPLFNETTQILIGIERPLPVNFSDRVQPAFMQYHPLPIYLRCVFSQ